MILHHELVGERDAPCIVLSTSLGARLQMWQPQMQALTQHFRVLRYDMRGHGASPSPAGPYPIAVLGNDVLQLLDRHNIRSAHFCGISLGGVIGQWLGIHAPNRVEKLILCNTAAKVGTEEGWQKRIAEVRANGMASIADTVISRWFTAPFATSHPEVIASIDEGMLACNPEGYIACCEALRTCDLRGEIANITAPSLIIAGEHDAVCTIADAQFLHSQIPNTQQQTLSAAHLSNVEAAEQFNQSLLSFLR
ncbi:3-oxoadipate enol-lactonase [Terriglobus sp. TAA 43]|uniref:3-oxoadipate enol-lactonase n=1 Tax=Terriglobus sp. TAA 43 TaxID=278961 RepID=UPI0006465C73|nr:3-oxoadipate enol-lactonase [Terriglobus sp. TAA 43]